MRRWEWVCAFRVGLGGAPGAGYWAGHQEDFKISAAVVESRQAQGGELASVTCACSNAAQLESGDDSCGVTIPFATRRFLPAHDGEIKAGVDLGEAGRQNPVPSD